MASLWLKLLSIGLICLSCIAKPTLNQETEFECVSMYKQPALQHPSMKNHQIQTKPSRKLLSMLSTANDDTNTEIVLTGSEECPKGQVPIHKPKFNLTKNLFHPQQFTKEGRLQKQVYEVEKMRKKNKLRINTKHNHTNSTTLSQKKKKSHYPFRIFREYNQHYAVIRTFANTTRKWRGAQALFNINKQRVAQNQHSKTWIWLNYIQMNIISSIQFGVAVHTKLYRDNRPRLTTYWMSQEQDGCYNALCPRGYVQAHRSIYPGMVYHKVSVPGGEPHTIHLSVAEDPVTNNWVLTTGTILIGYWPRQFYMKNGASEDYFGGFAGTSLPQTLSPPMGNGNFPTNDLTRSPSFMKQLKYVIPGYTIDDINSNEIEYYVDDPNCYGVMYLKYLDFDSRETLTFGGPGGHCRR